MPFVHPGTVTRNESVGTFFSCALSGALRARVVATTTIIDFMNTFPDHCPSVPHRAPARERRDRRNDDTRQGYGRVPPRGRPPSPSATRAPADPRRYGGVVGGW